MLKMRTTKKLTRITATGNTYRINTSANHKTKIIHVAISLKTSDGLRLFTNYNNGIPDTVIKPMENTLELAGLKTNNYQVIFLN